MVIVNFDVEECCQISSDKRTISDRVNRRRGNGIRISALDQVIRNAPSGDFNVCDLPNFKYSAICNRTKHFFTSSYEKVKDFGRLFSPEEYYCYNCRETKRLSSLENKRSKSSIENKRISKSSLENQTSKELGDSKVSHKRFSDSFVEKVQSQHQSKEMPCCAVCRKPRPPEYYCLCQEQSRKVPTHSCCYRRSSPKRKKSRKWWCCRKKTDDWDQVFCMCDSQKVKRKGKINYCKCKQNPSMFQKIKCCINGGNSDYSREEELCNRGNVNYRDDIKYCGGGMSQTPCNWCQRGYNFAKERNLNQGDISGSRSQRSSLECMKIKFTEDDYDDDTTESDDCCCCCPCRKNYNTTNIQTESLNCNLCEPKNINTQTEHIRKKKRCCKCCRKGCGICRHIGGGYSHGNGCTNKPKCKFEDDPVNMRNEECFNNEIIIANARQGRSTADDGRKMKTRILKSASVQHEAEQCEPEPPVIRMDNKRCDPRKCPFSQMQNVMFSNMKPSPLFLDKMFTAPLQQGYKHHKSLYNSPHTPFLSTSYSQSNLCLNDESFHISDSPITTRTKKRFLNAVCDSILFDLTSKRRNSISSFLKSPDSGYQDELSPKRSLFSFKKQHQRSNSTSTTTSTTSKVNKMFSNFSVENNIENMLKTLNHKKDQKDTDKNKENNDSIMGEASKVVRGVLEEIAKNSENNDSTNLYPDSKTHELLKRESLKQILLGMGSSKGDSGVSNNNSSELQSFPCTSSVADESYYKLLQAMESIRNRTKTNE